jgi:hypothetical protein
MLDDCKLFASCSALLLRGSAAHASFLSAQEKDTQMRLVRTLDVKSWIKENDAGIVISLAAATWYAYKWNRDGRDPNELILLVAISSTLAFLGVLRFRFQIYQLIVRDARALVCSLGDNPMLAEEAERDAEVYRNHFPAVSVFKAPKLADLLATLSAEDFRVLHILGEFSDDGQLVESQGAGAEMAPLFELCRAKKVLFVYFGGNIPDAKRDAVFGRASAARVGHDFPLVITTDRGTEFHPFLDELLREIGKGSMIGLAWLMLRPQDASPGAPQPAVDPGPRALLLL